MIRIPTAFPTISYTPASIRTRKEICGLELMEVD
jgi:hypothetical protein